jgi:hypothetical protein
VSKQQDSEATELPVAESRDWFQVTWNGMTQGEQGRVKAKAQWEHMSLRAVLQDWPTLAPPGVWHLIPKPDRRS